MASMSGGGLRMRSAEQGIFIFVYPSMVEWSSDRLKFQSPGRRVTWYKRIEEK
jgi:hypothetical protein